MPGFDGTGPEGRGAYGRGLGPCGNGVPRFRRGFFGFGRGRRWSGRGFGFWQHPVADEKTQLETERNWLQQQLDAINNRLSDIKKD